VYAAVVMAVSLLGLAYAVLRYEHQGKCDPGSELYPLSFVLAIGGLGCLVVTASAVIKRWGAAVVLMWLAATLVVGAALVAMAEIASSMAQSGSCD
jgi:hypothetical protein